MFLKNLLLTCALQLALSPLFAQLPQLVVQSVTTQHSERRILSSYDHRYLLTYDKVGANQLWDVKTGRLIQNFQIPGDSVGLFSYLNNGLFAGPSLSPDNKYLVTENAGGDREGYLLWDINTGKISTKVNKNLKGDDVGYNYVEIRPNNFMLTHGLNRTKNAYEIGARIMGTEREVLLNYDPQSAWGNNDFRGGITACSNDLSLFALGTVDGGVYLYDFQNGKTSARGLRVPTRKLHMEKRAVTKLCFSPDGQFISAGNPRESKVWNVKTGKVVNQIIFYKRGSGQNWLRGGLSNQGTKALLSEDENIKIIDVFSNKVMYQQRNEYKERDQLIFSLPSWDFALTEDGESVFGFVNAMPRIFESNLRLGTKRIPVTMSNLFGVTSTVYDDKRHDLYIGKTFNDALILNLKTGNLRNLRQFIYEADTIYGSLNDLEKTEIEMSTTKNLFLNPARSYLMTMDAKTSAQGSYAYVWDLKTGQAIDKSSYFIPDENEFNFIETMKQGKKWDSEFLRHNGKKLRMTFDKSGLMSELIIDDNSSMTSKKIVIPIDKITGKPMEYFQEVKLSADGSKLIAADTDGKLLVFDTRSGKIIRSFSYQDSYYNVTSIFENPDSSLLYCGIRPGAGLNSSVAVFNLNSGKLLKTLGSHNAKILSVNVLHSFKLMITVSEDRTVKFWNTLTGKLLATMAVSGKEYFMYTPDGYHMASRRGKDLIHYVKDKDVFLAQQFDLIYNRPDKVLGALGTVEPKYLLSLEKAYQKRLQVENLKFSFPAKNEIASAPQVTLKYIETNSIGRNAELRITCKDNIVPLKVIKIWVNGVKLHGYTAGDVGSQSVKEINQVVKIPLSSGLNTIEVAATNQSGVESLHSVLEVQGEQTAKKPDLYIVAIGVGKYKSLPKLTYPVKDVEDLTRTLTSRKENYNRIFTDTLKDGAVTQKNLLAVKAKLSKAGPDDHIIFFYAGHGLLENDIFYLGTSLSVEANHASGIPIKLVEDLLAASPSRNKLVLLDACNSGRFTALITDKKFIENNAQMAKSGRPQYARGSGTKPVPIDTELQAFDLMQDTFEDLSENGTGATILAATRVYSVATESSDLKNGLFTSFLIKGFQRLEADLDGNKQVNVYELCRYLQDSVSKASNQNQRPVLRSENQLSNFRVW